MANKTLRDELSNDPNNTGYSTMTNGEVANSLNQEDIIVNKDTISGSEVWNHTDPDEFTALADNAQQRWLALCGVDSVDPFGPAEAVATDIFSAGSTTLSNLDDFRTEEISRADELGLGEVKPYDVTKAREQLGLI